MALQTLVTRRIDAFDPVVITITRIQAGTAGNVIPPTANLLGTIRSVSEKARETARDGVRRVAEGVAAAHGVDAKVHVVPGYPVTVNDAGSRRSRAASRAELVGERRRHRHARADHGRRGFLVRAAASAGRDRLPRRAAARAARASRSTRAGCGSTKTAMATGDRAARGDRAALARAARGASKRQSRWPASAARRRASSTASRTRSEPAPGARRGRLRRPRRPPRIAARRRARSSAHSLLEWSPRLLLRPRRGSAGCANSGAPLARASSSAAALCAGRRRGWACRAARSASRTRPLAPQSLPGA